MTVLPTIGGDRDTWGAKLVAWLESFANADGTLKIGPIQIALGGSLPSVGVSVSGDTTGAADLAAIQAAHDGLSARGGSIQLGMGTFYTNGALVFTKPVTLRGWGGGIASDTATPPAALTTIYCKSQTSDGITCSGGGSSFSDFALINTYAGTPTAGAGIHDTAMSHSTIHHVTVMGFYNNLDLGGVYYNVSNCWIYDSVNYGIYMHGATTAYNDHGDMGIVNCVISKIVSTVDGGTAVRWESGGGLRFTANKINAGTQVGHGSTGKFDYGLQCVALDGVSTSVFPITGNSIENCKVAAIYFGTYGSNNTGYIARISITGNEISSAAALTGDGIVISPGAVWNFTDDIIAGNTISMQSGHKCIWVKNLDGFSLSKNQCRGSYHNFIDSGCSNFDVDSAAGNNDGAIVYNATKDNAAWPSRPAVDAQGITGLAASATVNLWRIDLTSMTSACMVEVTISGRMVGSGGVAVARTKHFFITSAAGTPTVVTPFVDQATGSATLDITATVNTSFVDLAATHADAGMQFRGNIALRVTGPMFNVAAI